MKYFFDKNLFITISNFVKKNIMNNIKSYYNSKESNIIYNNLNLCNNDEKELDLLQNISNIVKENNPIYSDYKIYLAVIYLYYGLVLEEPVENYLIINDIKYIILNNEKKYQNYNEIINLIFEIASSEKKYCSKIRKIFFNFD